MTDGRTRNLIIPALLTSFLIAFLIISVFPLVSAGTGSTGDRTWQFNVDTSTFRPDEYLVTVTAVDEDGYGPFQCPSKISGKNGE